MTTENKVTKEIWKDVKGYEGLYRVSNLGRVKRLEKKVWCKPNNSYSVLKEQILKGSTTKNGYRKLTLTKDGVKSDLLIHRLMALSFIPNPEKKRTVNHIDEVRDNNYLSNLEWSTYSENNNHGNRNKTVSRKLRSSILCKKVYQYDLNGNYIRSWDSLSKASRAEGYSISGMSACALGKRESSGGYKWSYKLL